MTRVAAAMVALLVLVLSAAPLLPRTIDDQVRDVASQLMCPVCEGRTVAESNSQLATQMRDLIRQRLLAGDTPETIIRYFIERYGESALATPPRSGLGVLIWGVPAAGIAAGLAWVWSRARSRSAADAGGEDDEPLTADERERLRQSLDEPMS